MTVSLTKIALCVMLSGAALFASADEIKHPVEKRKFNLPPSATLNYNIKAQQSGLQLSGNAVLNWNTADEAYHIESETRAMLIGKILDSKSDGTIDEYGLAPAAFNEKRFHKDPTATTFNRETAQISFSKSSDIYPILGGEQDRTSVIWQLIAVARGMHSKFKEGSEWNFFVAGQHDAEEWSFKVDKMENIRTPLGNMNAMHVIKAPPPDAKGQLVDIWLAPSLEWYPVRLRFTEANGDYVEQLLESVTKPGKTTLSNNQ